MVDPTPKWITYTLVNSFLCICGAFMVPLISIIFRTKKNTNSKLINYGLSLSSGSMITTSFYKMLPKMNGHNNIHVFVGMFLGIFVSFFLNYLVHSFASESLLHCAHEGEHEHQSPHGHSDSSRKDATDTDLHTHHNHGHSTQHILNPPDELYHQLTDFDENQGTNSNVDSEDTPLISSDVNKASFSSNSSGTISKIRSNSLRDNCVPVGNYKKISCCTRSLHDELKSKSVNRSTSLNSQNTTISELNSENGSEALKTHCRRVGLSCLVNDVGYDLENLSTYRQNFLKKRTSLDGIFSGIHKSTVPGSGGSFNESESTIHPNTSVSIYSAKSHQTHKEDHHHHLETPFSKLISIGLQTCLALTLHKFPEGFIIYYTNRSDEPSEIGLSIFISLAVHNFVEGFSMTLPFYAALESHVIPILITTVLGGGSQPLGALIGYLFFKNKGSSDVDGSLSMDFFLSFTAGFLLVIGLQMFQTGVGFSDTHHHHGDEDDSEVREAHSLGTTCLNFCCFGVLLILGSGLVV